MARSAAAPIHRDVPTFDVVDAVTPVGSAPCAECRGAIVDTYYEADQSVICAACHARIMSQAPTQSLEGRFGRAVGFGVLAALASAAAYVALLVTTGREMTVALLLVGLAVGKAVRVGSRGRGGRRFQWLAVTLTYVAIATTYVPFVVKGYSRDSALSGEAMGTAVLPTAGTSFLSVAAPSLSMPAATPSLGDAALGLGALLLLAVAAPVLEAANHLVVTLIMLATLYQAWRMNRRVDITITGPYRVRAPSA